MILRRYSFIFFDKTSTVLQTTVGAVEGDLCVIVKIVKRVSAIKAENVLVK